MYTLEVHNGFVCIHTSEHADEESALDKAAEFTVGTITLTHPDGDTEDLSSQGGI